MKWAVVIVAVLATILEDAMAQDRALFVKNDILERVRQGTLREYLPPSNTQKPRPFEPVSPVTQPPPGNYHPGYPPAGSITPQPPFPIYTNPATGAVTGEGYTPPNNEISPPEYNGYPSSVQPQPPFTEGHGQPGFPPSTGYPQKPTTGYPQHPTTGYPQGPTTGHPQGPTTGYPQGPTTGYPQGPTTGYPEGPTTGYPAGPTTGFPTAPPTGYPTKKPGFPSHPPPSFTTGYPTHQPSYTTGYPTQPTHPPTSPSPDYPTDSPITSAPHVTTNSPTHFTSPEITTQSPPEVVTTTTKAPYDNEVTEKPGDNLPDDTGNILTTSQPPSDDDLKHPPHIHAIDVQCAKDMMTINIEFNREFNGVIYSKGFYSTPECRYVNANSEQTKYKFTVSLNSCGTEFINAFDTQGQSYLENVLVLQNEPGIQEVWDTIRSVRCLWEGNLKESLSVALSVGMLSQEIVTFSGDTAMAKLDIQMGRGPFAPSANGLVKIGETMTLVVSVSGDPGFDIQVKDCRATDSDGDNVVSLTDDNGCVLKPKLFGAFQKTRNTGSTGASIIAYAFFSAFKFPDVMDLMIECNIELCKTDCQVCSEPDQKLEPGRRKRRDLYSYNQTIGEGVTMGRHLRVILPQDLSDGNAIINLGQNQGVCMSTQNFVLSSAIMISLLTASCLFSAFLWLKTQRFPAKQ